MNKPRPIESNPYYDLISVLKYIDNRIPGFHKKMWKLLCEMAYINNDTTISIYWDGLVHDDSDEDIVDGINYMFAEFPDIKTESVDFRISW